MREVESRRNTFADTPVANGLHADAKALRRQCEATKPGDEVRNGKDGFLSHSPLYTQRVHSATLNTLVDARDVYTHHGRMTQTPDTDIRAIGQRIVQTRAALDMSQADFARFLGFSTAALSNYETGLRRPSIDQAFAIVRATGVTLDWIYMGNRSGLPLRLAEKIPNETPQTDRKAG